MSAFDQKRMDSVARLLFRARMMLQGIPNYWNSYSDAKTEDEETALIEATAVLTRRALEILDSEMEWRTPLTEEQYAEAVAEESRAGATQAPAANDKTDQQPQKESAAQPTPPSPDEQEQSEENEAAIDESTAVKKYLASIDKAETGRLSWRERQKIEGRGS